MLTAALTNNLVQENLWDRPTEVLLMAACVQQGVLDRPSLLVMRWRYGGTLVKVLGAQTRSAYYKVIQAWIYASPSQA